MAETASMYLLAAELVVDEAAGEATTVAAGDAVLACLAGGRI